MILFLPVNLKEVHAKGRAFPWKKPASCSSCGSCRVWGHGFVWSYFDEIRGGVLLKRYRCPDCRTVYRCRPTGYFKRFQASIDTIQESVVTQAERGRWLPTISRTRQRHWYRALLRRIAAYLGATWSGGVVGGFVALMSRGLTPVARRI